MHAMKFTDAIHTCHAKALRVCVEDLAKCLVGWGLFKTPHYVFGKTLIGMMGLASILGTHPA
jgi:hypothetical protein